MTFTYYSFTAKLCLCHFSSSLCYCIVIYFSCTVAGWSTHNLVVHLRTMRTTSILYYSFGHKLFFGGVSSVTVLFFLNLFSCQHAASLKPAGGRPAQLYLQFTELLHSLTQGCNLGIKEQIERSNPKVMRRSCGWSPQDTTVVNQQQQSADV